MKYWLSFILKSFYGLFFPPFLHQFQTTSARILTVHVKPLSLNIIMVLLIQDCSI